MWHFQTIDPLECLAGLTYIAVVGAGGKTSLCEYLGAAAEARGRRAVLATTTKIWAKEPFATLDGTRPPKTAPPGLLHVGKTAENGKLTGLDEKEVRELGKRYDLVLIEADGAKGMPLKYPSAHEPVIPSFSDRIVVVAGLDALGATVGDKVFRDALFLKATGLGRDTVVTPDVFLRLFAADALLKGVDPGRCTIVLNKYDACAERDKVWELARETAARSKCRDVIVASVKHGLFYKAGAET